MRVFDPDNPDKIFFMENGQVVEDIDYDLELGQQGEQTEITVLEEETVRTKEDDSRDKIEENKCSIKSVEEM